MRMSCNGCRVLRKGCSETCTIRPCLAWIPSPSSQANAVVFLAKFYGRAGLLNLLNAAPHHLQPGVFRSLLYEAAGRIVNPIYGSVGLLWSGSWERCQAAVDAVLRGAPIVPGSAPESAGYDIRHVVKQEPPEAEAVTAPVPRKERTSSTRSSRGGRKRRRVLEVGFRRAGSHESSVTHPSWLSESGFSASPVNSVELEAAEESDVELELTLGRSILAPSSPKH